jgi:hypothetical protein
MACSWWFSTQAESSSCWRVAWAWLASLSFLSVLLVRSMLQVRRAQARELAAMRPRFSPAARWLAVALACPVLVA